MAKKSNPFFKGTVRDMFNGRPIEYPQSGKTVLPYDNLFTAKGSWIYVNSTRVLADNLQKRQQQTVEEQGENWVTVIPHTGEIVQHSLRALEFLPGSKPNGKVTKHRRSPRSRKDRQHS